MSFKDFDFLSQEISLFFYGRKRHSANYGALLTIIMIICCIIYMIYIFYEVFMHTSSTIQYYRHYFKNPGNYSFNRTEGIFHFFNLFNHKENKSFPFDKKYIRIFMTEIYEEYKINPELLSESDHWVYDNCRDGIDNDMSKDLFKENSIKYGICLRYYYNSNNKQYYPLEDTENFKYPILINKGSNMDYSISTIIEKCYNDSKLTTLLGPCADEGNISDFFKTTFNINFNVLTHEIRPGVYEETTYNYIYEISNSLRKKYILENKLIFSPLLTNFKLGVFLPNTKQNQIYTFSDNYAETEEKKDGDNLLCVYKFYLANYGYIYKASYQTIYDSLYKIGGIFQLIYYIFFGVNFIFNKYTIANDIKDLFFTLHNNKKLNERVNNFTEIINRLRQEAFRDNSIEIIHTISNSNRINNNNGAKYSHRLTNNFQESSSFQNNLDNKNISIFPFISNKESNIFKNSYIKELINDEHEYENHEIKINNKNSCDDKVEGKKVNIYSNKFQDDNDKNKKKDNIIIKPLLSKNEKKENPDVNIIKSQSNKHNFRLNFPLHDRLDKDILDFKNILKKYLDYKRRYLIYEKMNPDKIVHIFNMKNYFTAFLCKKEKNNVFFVLQNFRTKLLSEEHFFKIQNSLYLIEKCFGLKETRKFDVVELFKNL